VTTQRKDPEKAVASRSKKTGTAGQKPAGRTPAAAPEPASGNREKILATALRLFTQYGVDATPTARISKEAGVSTGTLFHYFPDKDKLVGALYLLIKKEMVGAIRNNADPSLPTKQRIEKAIRGFILWGVENPLKIRFIDQCYNYPGIGEDVRQEIYVEFSWMEGLMQAAIREGLLPDLPFEFHGTMLYQIMSGILSLIESGESGMSNEEIIANGLAMLWKR
jgi:AcrR family transcriptional regulator